jgi:hypothetical protein
MMRLQGLWRLFACQRDACGRSDHHVLSCRRWVRSAGHLSPMDGPYVAHIHHVSHLCFTPAKHTDRSISSSISSDM